MTKVSFKEVVQRLWPVLRVYRWRFGLGIVLIVITTATDVINPILVGQAADVVSAPHPVAAELIRLCLLFLGMILGKSVFEAFQAYVIQTTGLSVTHDLRTLVFEKIERLPVVYFDHHPTGRLLTRVINDIRSLAELFTASMSVLVLDAMVIIGTIAAMFVMEWKLAALVLLTFPLVIWVILHFGERLAEVYREVRARLAEINSFLGENIGAVATIQRLGAEEARYQSFEKIVEGHQEAQLGSIRIYALVQPWANVLNGIAMATLLGVGGLWVIDGKMKVGVLVAFLGYLRNLFQPVRDLVEKYNVFLSSMVSAERVAKILEEPEEGLEDQAVTLDFKPSQFGLRFQDVSFSYEGRNEQALKNVSFEIPAGKTLAIVGATGSGKSTIVRLLLRFYELQKGEIYFAEKSLMDWPRKTLRQHLGYVPQEVYLFQGSVRDNLTLGRAGYLDSHLEDQCRRSQFWEFIRDRGGLDLEILEGGTNLSLGQRQLLSFARILVLNPEVLVLDEATASLDNVIEGKLMVAVEEVMKGRTAIIIAHRLSTIEKCDSVLVMENGNVVERGRFHELAIQGGAFQKFHEIYKNA